MTDILDILRNPVFLEQGIAELKHYGDGEMIVSEGAEDRSIYLIEKGSARVTERVELEDNRHIQPGLCDLSADDIFGELSLFEAAPRSASVIAIEDCEMRVFDALALSDYFEAHTELGYPVVKALFIILSSRLRQADRRLGSLFAWGLKAHGIDQHL